MTPTEWPLLDAILNAGTDDPVFQALLLVGPFAIALIVLLGRTPITTGVAGGFLAILLANILRNGLAWRRDGNRD